MNQDIQEFQEKIRNTKYENQALLGNIAVVNHKLIQEEIEYKWLQMRENILVDQKKQTLKDKLDAQNEIVSKCSIIGTQVLPVGSFKFSSVRLCETPFPLNTLLFSFFLNKSKSK